MLRGSNTKIVLIDGDGLLDLMLRHHVGARVERMIELLDLDHNYFEEPWREQLRPQHEVPARAPIAKHLARPRAMVMLSNRNIDPQILKSSNP